MDPGVLLQAVLTGLADGAVLGLVALGFTLVAGTVRVLQLAHGDVVIAAVLAVEMKGLLIGEAASAETDALIRAALGGAPHVTKLIHLRSEHLGPDELLVTAKLEFDRSLSVEQLADAINAAEAALRASVPIARLVYLEPDIARA